MLREQVITPRARSSSAKGRAQSAQRPQPRRAAPPKRKRETSSVAVVLEVMRDSFAWLAARRAFVGKCFVALLAGVLLFAAYRTAASASFFDVRRIDVEGATRASEADVRAIVRRIVQPTGVWRADLAAISAAIQRQQPFVRSVVVTRVLPSGIRVRLTERTPEAVIRTNGGRLMWVDADGVLLDSVSASEANGARKELPPFFIRGWDESATDDARIENRERLNAYREALDAWTKAGIADRVSEINLGDLRDVRAQLSGKSSQVEVRLGREQFGERLVAALEKFDQTQKTDPERAAKIVVIYAMQATSRSKRIVFGFDSGEQSASQ